MKKNTNAEVFSGAASDGESHGIGRKEGLRIGDLPAKDLIRAFEQL